MTTEVTCGWVINDQAAVIKGMSFGPDFMKGRQRSGPLGTGRHNLIFKDVIFRAAGKDALRTIVEVMAVLDRHYIRCGIREGMLIEKDVPSEYGGGDDQIRVEATEDDIVRVDYYLYVFPEDESAYSFSSLITKFGAQLTGFVPGSGIAHEAREIVEGLGTLFQQATSKANKGTDIDRALKANKVIVLLTAKKQTSRTPVATHKRTHRISSLAGDIRDAVQRLA